MTFNEIFTKPLKDCMTYEEYLLCQAKVFNYQDENNIERWTEIPGYNGLYKASNLARVKKLDTTSNSLTRETWGILLPQQKGNNYYMYIISNSTKRTLIRLDYLVAITFIENPNNSNKILHIDNNSLNCKKKQFEVDIIFLTVGT